MSEFALFHCRVEYDVFLFVNYLFEHKEYNEPLMLLQKNFEPLQML